MLGLLIAASAIVALMRVVSGHARPELESRMYTWWGIAGEKATRFRSSRCQ
jgi:hypothetical protein